MESVWIAPRFAHDLVIDLSKHTPKQAVSQIQQHAREHGMGLGSCRGREGRGARARLGGR